MDCTKVEAIQSWPQPGTMKDLQRFLGFANFYRRFISGYSELKAPLTSLLCRKPKTLSWTSDAIEAFQKLKAIFCTAPTLVHPDPTWPFVVEVDASALGVGAVLSQWRGEPPVLHPCAFFSKKLSLPEQNYDIGDHELLATKLALEEWQHWLKGANRPFKVITDYKNLQYLREAKHLNPRQACGSCFSPASTSLSPTVPKIKTPKPMLFLESIPQTQCQKIRNPYSLQTLQCLCVPSPGRLTIIFMPPLKRNPLPSGGPEGKAYVPTSLRLSLMDSVHASPGPGHPGRQRTFSLFKEKYWWPNMAQDVARFVRGCSVCDMISNSRRLPWSHLGTDFATDLPVPNGFTTILVTVKRFSNACKLVPLKVYL
ncbi:hypothetical protein QTP70_013491 [Hemibagrus guttatus]|uniref:Gypsy retrotransposon integrase-like protein 1 n=1 Tax=Hemibagrus guttatus TaxID=175788 RepID=A0AAE0Q857_9TELE|nr:hypothetical protein QTP70_013491 [Hemibagrus guttatus]